LWQRAFFDRAIRTVKAYHEKVEYIHLNPVRAGFVTTRKIGDGQATTKYAGMSVEEQKRRCGLIVDRVRMPSDPHRTKFEPLPVARPPVLRSASLRAMNHHVFSD